MKPLVLDKVASVTANCDLSREVRISSEFPCLEGDVVAVRVLTRKSTYYQLELNTGRFSDLKPGDVIAGALGHRSALRGYAGRMPTSLQPGETINILNLGGVLGVCESFNQDVGRPTEVEVLGQILHFPYVGERIGVPANITQGAVPIGESLDLRGVPVIAVVGTSMSAGKTYACTTIIQELTRRRVNVAAAKATGVSLRRDLLAMEDAGASSTVLFTDLGVVTTTAEQAPNLARTMLTKLAMEKPDVIVLELGDGLLGNYGVDAILADAELAATFSVVVLAANDPVGAWGGVQQLRDRFGLATDVITGPATDNAAGTVLLKKLLGCPAENARANPAALGEVVWEKVKGGDLAERDHGE